jgi:hypothetical protein
MKDWKEIAGTCANCDDFEAWEEPNESWSLEFEQLRVSHKASCNNPDGKCYLMHGCGSRGNDQHPQLHFLHKTNTKYVLLERLDNVTR